MNSQNPQQLLKINIEHGSWMVHIINERDDNGVYELVKPMKEVALHLDLHHIYGFEYAIAAREGTPFSIYFDDIQLVEGKVGPSGIARGRVIV